MVIISSVCYLILCASVALLPTVGRAQRGGGTVWAKKGVAASVLGAPLRLAPCIWPRQSRLYALCVCSDCPERKSRIYIVCFLKPMFSEAAPLAWQGWMTSHTFFISSCMTRISHCSSHKILVIWGLTSAFGVYVCSIRSSTHQIQGTTHTSCML